MIFPGAIITNMLSKNIRKKSRHPKIVIRSIGNGQREALSKYPVKPKETEHSPVEDRKILRGSSTRSSSSRRRASIENSTSGRKRVWCSWSSMLETGGLKRRPKKSKSSGKGQARKIGAIIGKREKTASEDHGWRAMPCQRTLGAPGRTSVAASLLRSLAAALQGIR